MTRITKDDIWRFTCGDCHIFAKAMHDLTGWPVHAFSDGEMPNIHAFVVAPSGRCVDIEGHRSRRAFRNKWLRNWAGHRIVQIDYERIRENWTGRNTRVRPYFISRHSYKRARELAPIVADMVKKHERGKKK